MTTGCCWCDGKYNYVFEVKINVMSENSTQHQLPPAGTNKATKYINEGAYGCVFRSHIPCEVNMNVPGDHSTIGKLMFDAKDIASENKAVEAMRLIDPEHLFTVRSYGTCKPQAAFLESDPEAKKCELLNEPHHANQRNQIVYQYGGVTLTKFIMDFSSGMPWHVFLRVFFKMGNLFFAAMRLSAAEKVHFDIKSENVLVDDEWNMKLIDFGLLANQDEIGSNSLISMSYRYFPPELRVYAHKTRGHQDAELSALTPDDVLAEYRDDVAFELIKNQGLFDPEDDVRKLFACSAEDIMHWSKKRIDVFTVGWLLALVVFSANNLSDAPPPARFVLMTLLRHMCRFHPEHRYAPEHAFEEHQRICAFLVNSTTAVPKSLMIQAPNPKTEAAATRKKKTSGKQTVL